jgi:hypothetical protein
VEEGADGWSHPISEKGGRAAAYPFGEEGSWAVGRFLARAGFGPAATFPFFVLLFFFSDFLFIHNFCKKAPNPFKPISKFF